MFCYIKYVKDYVKPVVKFRFSIVGGENKKRGIYSRSKMQTSGIVP